MSVNSHLISRIETQIELFREAIFIKDLALKMALKKIRDPEIKKEISSALNLSKSPLPSWRSLKGTKE